MAEHTSATEPVPQVLAEIDGGDVLSCSAVARQYPGHRGGRSLDASTIWRWMSRGSKRADGSLVRLEAVRVGSRWLTSRAALQRFISALSADPAPAEAAPTARGKAAGRKPDKAGESAGRRLEKAGW